MQWRSSVRDEERQQVALSPESKRPEASSHSECYDASNSVNSSNNGITATSSTCALNKDINNDPVKHNESSLTKKGLYVLALLATQNCFKNLLMRYVMVDKPEFLLSTAVITTESLKLIFSSAFILFQSKQQQSSEHQSKCTIVQSFKSIYQFIFRDDWKNSLLLIFPAICYNLQMTLEYVAFANIDAAQFAVVVQMKMLTTAFFFRTVLGKKMKKKQVMSLVILTVGVMSCNMKMDDEHDGDSNHGGGGNKVKGIMATIGIAVSSGFASVYTEKVIKSSRMKSANTMKSKEQYGLAHMQCQLATVSLVILGMYAFLKDSKAIMENGLFQHFNGGAFLSCLNSAIGGLIVASVLKYADSVLKGYATAVSVVLTGVFSSYLFDTKLTMLFGLGIVNVVMSTMLYNGSGFDDYMC